MKRLRFLIFIISGIFIYLSINIGVFTGSDSGKSLCFRTVRSNGLSAIFNSVKNTVGNFENTGDITSLSPEEAKNLAENKSEGIETEFGSYAFMSKVKARSAPYTVNIGNAAEIQAEKLTKVQQKIKDQIPETLKLLQGYLGEQSFTHIKGYLGSNSEFTPECHLFLSRAHDDKYQNIAHMVAQTVFPEGKGEEQPKYTIIDVPEWAEVAEKYAEETGIELEGRQVLRFPDLGITIVLGSDYYGEVKKGFLTQMGWDIKNKQGRLALHAGARIDKVRDAKTGRLKTVGTVLLGLSATGKTTLTAHNYGLNPELGEKSFIVQDDFTSMLINPEMNSDRPLVIGWEDGFYLKTDAIDATGAAAQPLILKAATTPRAIFENIAVDPETGEIDFNAPGPDGTTNQRGIMKRTDLVLDGQRHYTQEPNMPSIEELDEINIIFITRQDSIISPISKLNKEQAAAFFMLGESVHSSASTQDKSKWGSPVNSVGTNPFIVGSQAKEGNMFYEMLKNIPEDKLNMFLVNTGMIGEEEKISVTDTTTILKEALRGSIEWKENDVFGLSVPSNVEGVEWERFNPLNFYTEEEILQMARDKYKQRMKWLKRFEDELDPAILNALISP